jgi:hypothetical protein
MRDIPVEMTIDDAWALYQQQEGLCALSGVPIDFGQGTFRDSEVTASLDRIDSSKGYSVKNVQWVHKRVNLMKLDMPQEEFFEWCKAVYQNCIESWH